MKNVMADMAQAPSKPKPSGMASASNEPSGRNPQPTKARLADREASPKSAMTSGMERAMGSQADSLHPRRTS